MSRDPGSIHRRGLLVASGAAAYLHRDALLADGIREALRRDGWGLRWARGDDGLWMAEISCPSPPLVVDGRGGSRVVAISRAHVAAVRLLAAPDVRINHTSGPEPDESQE